MSYARQLADISRHGIITVNTVADLRAHPFVNSPELMFETLGALSAADGGGGLWRWDAASLDDDNLGTVVLPTGHVGPGRRERVFSGFVNACWFGGTTAAAIQEAIFACYAEGGGTVLVPKGHFVGTDVIWFAPHVSVVGEGSESHVEITGGAVFGYGEHFHPAAINAGHYTFHPLNSIAGGSSSVTLTNAADAANYSVGDIAMVSSTGFDSPGMFEFVELNRIVDIDGGVLTFESGFVDDVASAQIANPKDMIGDSGHPLNLKAALEGVTLSNLRATCSDPQYQALRLSGLYNGSIHDLWLTGSHMLAFNLSTKSKFYNIINNVTVDANLTNTRLVELKMGSYQTQLWGLQQNVVALAGATPSIQPPVNIGERSRDISIRDVIFNASGHHFNEDFIRLYRCNRVSVSNVKANLKSCTADLMDIRTEDVMPDASFDITNINILLEEGSFTYGIALRSVPTGIGHVNVNNVSILVKNPSAGTKTAILTPSEQAGTYLLSNVSIPQGRLLLNDPGNSKSGSVRIENAVVDSIAATDPNNPGVVLSGITVLDNTSQPLPIYVLRHTLLTGTVKAFSYELKQNPQFYPDGFSLDIDIRGSIDGTRTTATTLTLTFAGTTAFTMTLDPADNGAFCITGRLISLYIRRFFYNGIYWKANSADTPTTVNKSYLGIDYDYTTTTLPLDLDIVAGADTVQIYHAEVRISMPNNSVYPSADWSVSP